MKTIFAIDLKKKFDANPKLMVINVLDRNYYQDCRIKGSLNIPYGELENKSKGWDKNKEIIVYCASTHCPKSSEAYKLLTNLGFKNIVAFEGGMKEWFQNKFPSEGSCKMDYLK